MMKKDKDIVRVAFYIRVSTQEQVRDGYGLDYQLSSLESLIEFKGKQIPKWVHDDKKHRYIDEGYSGSNLERNSYKEMMKAAKNGEFDIIAVWKIDRMSRNLTHLLKTFEDLKKYDVSFFSLKENIDFSGPVGRLTFQIFGALAEFEREMIQTRTLEGKMASAKKGNYTGNRIPYGYQQGENKKIVVVPQEKKIVIKIFNWFIFDRLSYSEIARKLNEMGISKGIAGSESFMNSKWIGDGVKNILQNQIYSGSYTTNFNIEGGTNSVTNIVAPCIKKNIYDFAQNRINEIMVEKSGGKRGGGKNEYLLSRKIYDVETGKTFVGYTRKNKSHGYRRKGYTDSVGIKHENIDITGKEIDEFVWFYIRSAIDNPKEFFYEFKKQLNSSDDIDRLKDDLETYTIQLKKKEDVTDTIELQYVNGLYSSDKRQKLIDKTNQEIRSIEKHISQLEIRIDNLLKISYSEDVIQNMSEKYDGRLDNLSISQKQILIESMVDRITASKNKDGDLKIDILFKFDLKDSEKKFIKDEHKKSTSKPKANGTSYVSCINGGSSGARTQDLLLKRELLYRLS